MRNRFFIFLAVSLGGVLFLAILLFGIAQTDFFQEFLLQKILVEAKEQGIALDVQEMKTNSPFKWKIQKLSFALGEDVKISADRVSFKVSPLSLLGKKLTFKSLSADKIDIAFIPSSDSHWTAPNPKDLSFTLPLDLYAKSISCKHIHIENLKTQKAIDCLFEGRGKIDRGGKEFSIDFLIKELETLNSLEVVGIASYKKQHLEATLEVKLADTQKLADFFNTSSLPSLKGTCKAHGGYLNPLSFEVISYIESLSLPNTTHLIQMLSFEASGDLFLDPKSPVLLSLQKLQITDPNLDIHGSFKLSQGLRPLACDMTLSLKEASIGTPLLPVSGEIEGKIHLDETSFLASFHSPSLTIAKQTYQPVDFTASATKENERWIGISQGTFEHPILPSKGSCRFTFEKDTLSILDFSLSLGDAKIGGVASCSFENLSYDGSFFIMAEGLKPLRLIFPDSEVDGRLGGSFSVKGLKGDLNLEISCLLKSIRYQNNLVDTAQIEAKVENLLTAPFGMFSCEAKNIFFREMLLSKVSILSEPAPEEMQTFSILVEGDWKQELHLDSSGLFKKTRDSWKLQLDKVKGTFLSESFSLESPFAIKRSHKEFLMEPCLWKIGDGELSSEFSLSSEGVIYKGEGNHIPLGILGVLYPKMAFQGTASFQSALTGLEKDLKGHFFLSLERADFSQNKAKGSLQIHLNPLGVQIYSHLYATNNQFLDWTATLPLTYCFSPFSWNIDSMRAITSELTMQGAVEEIFDFVNTASHKATGWITTHLFLSGTLKQPSILGSLNCEQGAYENYFTGTHLTNIEAEIRASSHTLELTSLKASDEKTGTLTGEGSLFLSPSEKYPFELKTELKGMHAVHSELIDASLSGFLHIAGDTSSSVASGNLTVDHALFKIFDELPYEIPTLPVTFINKPIHLQTSVLQTASPYPLYLDVGLSSEDSVFVEGRGLDSNWQGNVQLTGTVGSPAAKGSLTLKRGEFVFSGKTFTLMHGEISFSDKPSPGAYLKINGELAMSSATILAQMQGPLTSPQLTFQSIPSLPTSSILSLILFDKDISEIGALEALQLAQTIVSLSGNGGPGVLESIRKKIGVDRLNIVGKDGTDEISVQIGWYLNHGITLSLSQSATSSDVTVEVDLKNGFIFQAETQNQEEGKFSFNWNKNY